MIRLICSALCILLLIQTGHVLAEQWAVIVAGSNGWYNYRHQADACHAYQIVSRNGIPAERIIVMQYDDIANHSQNPFPGQIFNEPASNKAGDVYSGCQKDYSGMDVTAENFLNVLKGNETALKKVGSGKVLKSTEKDHIFVYFVDHGATGVLAFPTGNFLEAADLKTSLEYMHEQKMYEKMVFYVEACESGSMFENVIGDDLNIYVTTASNAEESSWATYCPPDDKINGVEMNTCLGDEYSVNWLQDTDNNGMQHILQTQFETVRKKTVNSHVTQYGDVTIAKKPLGEFMGEKNGHVASTKILPHVQSSTRPASSVRSRDVPLHIAYYKYLRASERGLLQDSHEAAQELTAIINKRLAADNLFLQLTRAVTGDQSASLMHSPAPVGADQCGACCTEVHKFMMDRCGGFDDYSMQYVKVIRNLCHHVSRTQNAVALNVIMGSLEPLCQARRA